MRNTIKKSNDRFCHVALRRLVSAAMVLTALVAVVSAVRAADTPSNTSTVDTANWKCRFCTYKYGWSGQVDAGLGKVSSNSFKFGEYTGLEKSGGFLLLDGKLDYRGKEGGFFDLNADHLGIASRSVEIDGGTQGLYQWQASWQAIPQYLFEAGRTPFLGLGSTTLTLPSNWVAGGSTSQMTNLLKDSHNVDIENTRHVAALGIRFTPPSSNWQYKVSFQRDTRTGTGMQGGSFLTTTTLLPEAMDYRTDQMQASANYRADRWQIGFGYYGSLFRNADHALTWDNPFSPITAGATRGQLSLPPDNAYHAVSITGAWQAFGNTRLMASVSRGRGTQDEAFLAATLNSQLGAAPLPQTDLNGEVDTLNYALRGYSTVTPDLNLTLDYTVDKRDNHTAQAAYQQVITDSYLANYATNIPYSFSRDLADLVADYRVSQRIHVEGGVSHAGESRTFRSIADTHTNSVWASMRANPVSSINLLAKASHERRFSGGYTAVDYLFSPQNPLMRQFDLASRDRYQFTGQLSYTPAPEWSGGFTIHNNNDKYDGTSIGLTQGKSIDYTLNLVYSPANKFNLNGYFTQESMAWRQAGSAGFASPDWYGERDDSVKTFGLTAEIPDIVTGLNGGADFSYSLARGTTVVMTGASLPAYPDLTMRMQHLSLFAKYQLNAKFALRLDYQIERYATTDWSLDGVSQNTISNVLALGIFSPNYIVNVVSLRAEYRF